MEKVLTRRFTHESTGEFDSFARMPDLLLMDGGRGQVNIALGVLEKLGVEIPVCGMVKDDHHRTRGLYFNNIEIPIDTNSEGFRLITRIQDEAHRFAIEYHRSLRSKEQVHSVLDDISGDRRAQKKSVDEEVPFHRKDSGGLRRGIGRDRIYEFGKRAAGIPVFSSACQKSGKPVTQRNLCS